MIYLAAPYSHENPEIETRREKLATHYAMVLTIEGLNIYSPLTHGCALVREAIKNDIELGTNFEAWKSSCLEMVSKADELWYLKFDGWEESEGLKAEILHARKKCIPVKGMDEEQLLGLIALGRR